MVFPSALRQPSLPGHSGVTGSFLTFSLEKNLGICHRRVLWRGWPIKGIWLYWRRATRDIAEGVVPGGRTWEGFAWASLGASLGLVMGVLLTLCAGIGLLSHSYTQFVRHKVVEIHGLERTSQRDPLRS